MGLVLHENGWSKGVGNILNDFERVIGVNMSCYQIKIQNALI